MRKVQYTVEELTCPECGFVAINANGLRGHRQFKHGVRPSGAQLPLQKQDLLVSESKLAELLDERLGVISEQVNELAGEVEQLAGAAKGDGAAITELQGRLSAAERKGIEDFSAREKAEFFVPWMRRLDPEEFAYLSQETGHEVQLVPAADPELVAAMAETFQRQAEEAKARGEKPRTVLGKTSKPGYKYLKVLNLSVREK